MATDIRDRIRELRRVKARDIRTNPKNLRKHPPEQQKILKQLIDSIGYVDALIARETDNGLELIDGHLRRQLTPDMEVPVLIVDLDDDEVDVMLATFDPVTFMAKIDRDRLRDLYEQITINDQELFNAVNMVIDDLGLHVLADDNKTADDRLIGGNYQVLIECESEQHQRDLLEEFIQRGLKCRALIL